MSEAILDKPEDNILATAKKILALGPICDSCLGRQFAMLSTGLTNVERGRSIKTVLTMQASADDDKSLLEDLAPNFSSARLKLGWKEQEDVSCSVCLDEMRPQNLQRWADKAVEAQNGWEYSTFLVGTRMSGLLAENEELLLADGGSGHAEPLKSELNREVGKLIAAKTKKQFDLKHPEIVFHLNLEKGEVELQIASIFIRGRYRKLARGIPQTRWPCRICKGEGCPRCYGTGKMYQDSVDELIRPSVIAATLASDTTFHGAGREDIDARMLGTGRPFIVEAVRPMRRIVDLARLRESINRQALGKVEVSELKMANLSQVQELKDAALQKTYRALVKLGAELPEEKLKSVLKELVGSIDQRTPTRVSHRRADKLRAKNVYSAKLIKLFGQHAEITIRGESGLYVKELISGDGGRTSPSLAGSLGVDAVVEELDVINVGGELNGTSSWNEEEDTRQAEQNSKSKGNLAGGQSHPGI